jgi:putative glycerol-1-phosphate prenyltransferase
MNTIYASILNAKEKQQKLLAILIDPDKIKLSNVGNIAIKINQSPANFIFIGGSFVQNNIIDGLIEELKTFCNLPLVLFPGNPSQISGKADAVLFLSLISGRNPDFLIENQIKAVSILKKTNLEIIPTGYILVKTGQKTAVELVSNTEAMSQNNINFILETAQAGEMLGHQLIYLEAGSGADKAVSKNIISLVAANIQIPLIVGGGIKSIQEIKKVFDSGADLVVIGTAFENNNNFFTAPF